MLIRFTDRVVYVDQLNGNIPIYNGPVFHFKDIPGYNLPAQSFGILCEPTRSLKKTNWVTATANFIPDFWDF